MFFVTAKLKGPLWNVFPPHPEVTTFETKFKVLEKMKRKRHTFTPFFFFSDCA
jgi:hypothetical protein